MQFSNIISKFGEGEVISLPEFKDVDFSTYPIVKKILDAYASGNISTANALRENNKEVLEGIEINAYTIFQLFEEIYNVELIAMSRHTDVYVGGTTPPASMEVGDTWFATKGATFN